MCVSCFVFFVFFGGFKKNSFFYLIFIFYLFDCLFIYVFVYLFVCLFVCLFVYLLVCLFIRYLIS